MLPQALPYIKLWIKYRKAGNSTPLCNSLEEIFPKYLN